jgi:hypothetical protein
MKLAWPIPMPLSGNSRSGETSSVSPPSLLEAATLSGVLSNAATPLTLPLVPQQSHLTRFWQQVRDRLKSWLPAPNGLSADRSGGFWLHQSERSQQIEQYAENPWEKMMFSIRKRSGDLWVSQAWASAIRSKNAVERESALNLWRDYTAYTMADTSTRLLSNHAQLKMLVFLPHLSEGAMGKALIYDALMSLQSPLIVREFADAMMKDFSGLPSLAQAVILRDLMAYWKARKKILSGDALGQAISEEAEEELQTLQKLVKTLIVQFFTGDTDVMEAVLSRHEKLRVGYLKMQPVEEDHTQQMRKVEQQFRMRLGKLKKERTQKMAEADEEKQRRIAMIYDDLESCLMASLKDLPAEMAHALAG